MPPNCSMIAAPTAERDSKSGATPLVRARRRPGGRKNKLRPAASLKTAIAARRRAAVSLRSRRGFKCGGGCSLELSSLGHDGRRRHFWPITDKQLTAEVKRLARLFELVNPLQFIREAFLPPRQGEVRDISI
jgi:hypothetical protein